MGKGTEADMEKARRWYTLAAEQGRPDAAYKLGQFYEHGIGVEEDMEKAEEWYQKAAEEDVEEEISIIEEEKKDTATIKQEETSFIQTGNVKRSDVDHRRKYR